MAHGGTNGAGTDVGAQTCEMNNLNEDVVMEESGQNDNCCICMEAIANGERAVLMPCKHIYHKKCIDQWFKTPGSMRSCSYCRTPAHEVQHSFRPDGTFGTDTLGMPRRPAQRRVRFLICVVTPGVYLYTIATESFFTIVNTSARTVELVDDNSQLVHTLGPLVGRQQLTERSLNHNLRNQDEPQVEFTLFNMDSFLSGTVSVPVNSTAIQIERLVVQEFVRRDAERTLRNPPEIQFNDEDYETPRMRRRRERIDRVGQAPPQPRQPRGRGGRGRGGRGRGRGALNSAAQTQ